MATEVDSKALFTYACNFARKNEESGKGTIYPKFRQAAKRFNANLDDIERACNDWDGSLGYMQPAVAVRSGNGIGDIERRGDWLVEAYTD
ncbi:hypothetical protein RYA05_02155 [Pseudomonas syringae pv. actinidiae]|nr:hypothetical protein [Pseudomonas syringae pv. actinidiae]